MESLVFCFPALVWFCTRLMGPIDSFSKCLSLYPVFLKRPSFPQWSKMHLYHIINPWMYWTYSGLSSLSHCLSLFMCWSPVAEIAKVHRACVHVCMHVCANRKGGFIHSYCNRRERLNSTPIPGFDYLVGLASGPSSLLLCRRTLAIPACGHSFFLGSYCIYRCSSG